MIVNHYLTLELEVSATPEEIRKAYKKLALKYHPDKNPNISSGRIDEVNNAYEILNDPVKKTEYDTKLIASLRSAKRSSSSKSRASKMYNPFNNGGRFHFSHGESFHRHSARPARPPSPPPPQVPPTAAERAKYNIEATVQVTLEEVYKGATIEATYTEKDLCTGCKGIATTNIICSICKGYTKTTERVMSVPLERGIPNRHKVVMKSKGSMMPNEIYRGDLVFIFIVSQQTKDGILTRKGDDLEAIIELSLKESLMGFSKTLCRQMDGRLIKVNQTLGNVTNQGDIFTIEDEGMPIYLNPNSAKGKMHIRFNVNYPTQLNFPNDPDLRELIAMTLESEEERLARENAIVIDESDNESDADTKEKEMKPNTQHHGHYDMDQEINEEEAPGVAEEEYFQNSRSYTPDEYYADIPENPNQDTHMPGPSQQYQNQRASTDMEDVYNSSVSTDDNESNMEDEVSAGGDTSSTTEQTPDCILIPSDDEEEAKTNANQPYTSPSYTQRDNSPQQNIYTHPTQRSTSPLYTRETSPQYNTHTQREAYSQHNTYTQQDSYNYQSTYSPHKANTQQSTFSPPKTHTQHDAYSKRGAPPLEKIDTPSQAKSRRNVPLQTAESDQNTSPIRNSYPFTNSSGYAARYNTAASHTEFNANDQIYGESDSESEIYTQAHEYPTPLQPNTFYPRRTTLFGDTDSEDDDVYPETAESIQEENTFSSQQNYSATNNTSPTLDRTPSYRFANLKGSPPYVPSTQHRTEILSDSEDESVTKRKSDTLDTPDERPNTSRIHNT